MDAPDEKRTSVWPVVVVACFVLPVLYVLSAGPAVWLLDKGYLPDSVVDFYEPINWLCRHFQLANDLIKWYLRLWSP